MREISEDCVYAGGEIKNITKMYESPAKYRRLGTSAFNLFYRKAIDVSWNSNDSNIKIAPFVKMIPELLLVKMVLAISMLQPPRDINNIF